MSDTLAQVYCYLLIGGGLLGLCLHAVQSFRRSPESEYSRRRQLRRKSLIRECLHLVIGGVGLALFGFGVLGAWAVIIVGGALVIVIEYTLALLIKPGGESRT